MKSFNEYLNESRFQFKVFIERNEGYDMLWASYSPGSGITVRIKNKYRDWWTNTNDPKWSANYDSIVDDIIEYANQNKPLKQTKIKRLFEIPIYNYRSASTTWNSSTHQDYSIWGGEIKPAENVYLVITQNPDTSYNVEIFKTKKEALTWLTI